MAACNANTSLSSRERLDCGRVWTRVVIVHFRRQLFANAAIAASRVGS
jgi:hypothetical protein